MSLSFVNLSIEKISPPTARKRQRTEGEVSQRKLVLILGGVLNTDVQTRPLNVIYKRLEDRQEEDAIDVSVVDIEPWISHRHTTPKPDNITHVQQKIEDYVTDDLETTLTEKYQQIVVIDDLFFKDRHLRDAIMDTKAWQTLTSFADEHPHIFSWWIIHLFNPNYDPKSVSYTHLRAHGD